MPISSGRMPHIFSEAAQRLRAAVFRLFSGSSPKVHTQPGLLWSAQPLLDAFLQSADTLILRSRSLTSLQPLRCTLHMLLTVKTLLLALDAYPLSPSEEALLSQLLAAVDLRLNLHSLRRLRPAIPEKRRCREPYRRYSAVMTHFSANPGPELSHIYWKNRDVLVGALRSPEQLDVSLLYNFYHVPAVLIPDSDFPIRYVAIYQSQTKFGPLAGIRYYGEVVHREKLPRYQITALPKDSNEIYYRFTVAHWQQLPIPVLPKELGFTTLLTSFYLLTHSAEVPELLIHSEKEYRLYTALAFACAQKKPGFPFDGAFVAFTGDTIQVYKSKAVCGEYPASLLSKCPHALCLRVWRAIYEIE